MKDDIQHANELPFYYGQLGVYASAYLSFFNLPCL